MSMSRDTFDDVPLSTLFPELSAADCGSLRRAALSVGLARPGAVAPKWEWKAEHAVFTGPQSRTHVILLLCVVQPARGSDWLEFQLQVGWTAQGQHDVTASVNVGCWCETDHGTHDVEVLNSVVGDEISLPEAFEACADRMAGWLADPRDADFWRAREDLPTRPLPRSGSGTKTVRPHPDRRLTSSQHGGAAR
ncbi:hypothetical protein [Streptacidiphilus jiangxiensis]|uniref:Uncharacterized protein n=1 Tax=Streptacidiphilus jiangxiensis TaxID=235985 RepID=A0A1H7Y6D2_STRJI|nr:hypothetical protein [Streptacidiphilus jiangxiensis]SEM41776.1 hypothetical protein SAMN05414137_12728 [Streptacidiphilus jiangxiensis]